MRKYLIFILLLSLITVACSQLQTNNNASDESTETAQETGEQEQEAPRVEVTATPSLPPTYTPEAMGRGGHISPVSTRTVHIVQAGETMNQIAAKYSVDTKFLADSNRIYNYHLIYVGQVLYIPPCE